MSQPRDVEHVRRGGGAREPRAVAGHVRRHGDPADGAVHRDVRDERGGRAEVQRPQGGAGRRASVSPPSMHGRLGVDPRGAGRRDRRTGASADLAPDVEAHGSRPRWPRPLAQNARSASSASTPTREVEVNRLEEVRKQLLECAAGKGLADDVRAEHRRARPGASAWSRATWSSSPTCAEPDAPAAAVLDTLAPVLARARRARCASTATPTRCKVKPKLLPTDWELSAARAVPCCATSTSGGTSPASA